jgi:hypothetical protein
MGAYSNRVIADGASYYWRLGETSGLSFVDAVGGKTATIASSAGLTYGVPGAIGDGSTGLATDGTQTPALITSVAIGTTCTIEFWIRRSVTWAAAYMGIIGSSTGGVSVYAYSNQINCFGPGNNLNNTALALNTIYHVVMSISAGSGTFYLNGVPDGTFTAWPGHPAWNALLNCSGVTSVQASLLDEVAIYPRALTAPEIAAHYSLASVVETGRPPLSFGYWKQHWPAA